MVILLPCVVAVAGGTRTNIVVVVSIGKGIYVEGHTLRPLLMLMVLLMALLLLLERIYKFVTITTAATAFRGSHG